MKLKLNTIKQLNIHQLITNKMSRTKFNGFEKYFIQTALRHAIDEAEKDVLAAEATGKRSIYAPGYFTLVGNEIIDKVNDMTLKKYKDQLQNKYDYQQII